MILVLGLGVLGLLLIYFEFFVPGGVLGVLGGVLMLLSLTLFIWVLPHLYWVLLYVGVGIVLLVLVIRLALSMLKKRPTMYAAEDQSGYLASKIDPELIGKTGKAVTNLSPSGHIEVEKERYQAISESAFIKKGELIKIICGEGARDKVRKDQD